MIRTYCDRCRREIPDGKPVYYLDYSVRDDSGVMLGDTTHHLCSACFVDLQAWMYGCEDGEDK